MRLYFTQATLVTRWPNSLFYPATSISPGYLGLKLSCDSKNDINDGVVLKLDVSNSLKV